jgi:hypothetical protein
VNAVRGWLRSKRAWVLFRRLQRTGWIHSFHRWRLLPRILKTRPICTLPIGHPSNPPCEVHILTWDRDWQMSLWAAKSFYHFSGVNWPLVWHEGGSLESANRGVLQRHFPQSSLLTAAEATTRVEAELVRGGYLSCLKARRRSFMLMKMIDCVVLSNAPRLLLLDSDVLFFRKPEELIQASASETAKNLFNRDKGSWYTVSREAAKARYRIDLILELNAGLGLVRRESLTLPMMEEFLADPDILAEPWLTEQTLQALCGSKVGAQLLPETYLVSQSAGLTTSEGHPLVAKHYAGFIRPLLYEEGMTHLIRLGFLESLSCQT